MKKQIVKRNVILIVITLLFSISGLSWARSVQVDDNYAYVLSDNEYKLSLRAQTGYLTGEANELVYDGSFSENLLSQLIWDIDELYMLGVGFSLQKSWVILHGEAWKNVADGEGVMDDYDWIMEGPSPGWSHWSHHDDTESTDAQIYDINFEFLVPQMSKDHFLFSLFLGYRYEAYDWDAKGGSYTYSVDTFRDTSGTFDPTQLGVSYDQSYKTPYVGIGLRGSFNRFELSARFIGSFFVSGEADDIHHLRNFRTHAKLTDGDMYEFDISGTCFITKQWALKATYTHTVYDTMKGNSTYYTVGEDQMVESVTYLDVEGMDFKKDLFSLALTYSF